MPHAIRITVQIASAVAYLHDRGICHCEVEARNVVVMQRQAICPIVKLSNFSQGRNQFHSFSWHRIKDTADLAVLLTYLPWLKDSMQ